MHTDNTLSLVKTGLAAVLICMSLSACATQSDRRGKPDRQDRQERGQKPSSRASGTFVKPIGLLMGGMDLNNDAITTRAELRSGIESEWSQFAQAPSAIGFANWSVTKLGSTDAFPTFMMFDRNMDGVISKQEFSTRLEADFTRSDKNSDGQLERSEMLVAFNAPQGRSGEGRKSGGEKGGRGGKGGGRPQR